MKLLRITLGIVLLGCLAAQLASCRKGGMNEHVVSQNEEFTVTGDSVIQGDIVVTARTPYYLESTLTMERLDSIERTAESHISYHGGRPWQGSDSVHGLPQYVSRQNLLNAVYNMSCDYIADGHLDDGYNAHDDYANLYASIYLSLAMLEPERSMQALRSMVSDGDVLSHGGPWPVYADRCAWIIAAWEVYLVTGDEHWLEEIAPVVRRCISQDHAVLEDAASGLMHGGITRRQMRSRFYPDWMRSTDIAQTIALSNNVLALRALEILGEIDEITGTPGDSDKQAEKLGNAINQQLWHEDHGQYTAMLYGLSPQRKAPLSDNLAQALAVVWDIADDDRANTLVERTPITHRGLPSVMPMTTFEEPYFTESSWATTQALWNLAACHVGNMNALRRGMGALLRTQAMFASRHIMPIKSPVNELAGAAASISMYYRVLAGMRLLPEGIEFNPMVPSSLYGDKEIIGWHYRQAVLNITIKGTGNEIVRMTVDGGVQEGNFVPGDLTGEHTIIIELSQSGPARSQQVTLANHVSRQLPWPQNEQWQVLGTSAMWLPLDSTSTTDTLHAVIKAERAGKHLLSVAYSDTVACDARIVMVNTHRQGVVVMPVVPDSVPPFSTTLEVTLLKGHNSIDLVRPPGMPPTARLRQLWWR